MRFVHIALVIVITSVIAGVSAGARAQDAGADGWADILRREQARGAPLPRLSTLVPGLDLELAYAIQESLVAAERIERGIGGYKAGFTAAPAQARFGLTAPVYGVLYADGEHHDGAVVELGDFARPMVELEIGFRLRSAIRRPMKSIEDLRTYVREAVPAVELPDLDYEDAGQLTGLDVVATNVASRAYVVGKPFVLAELATINELSVALYRDGERIDEGHAKNAMGDQLAALLWLVNRVQAAGWPLEAGQLLITGTLGRINPAAPGHYRAEYRAGAAPRGALEFTLAGAAQARAK
ncbi:MAG: 4-oxalocrotonate decarboxylase [Gammaproteobacteria bacterium]